MAKLSPVNTIKLNNLREILKVSERELIPKLIDIAYAEDADSIEVFRRNITNRVKAGVGYGYMTQLKLLHSILSVYLKRTGYL